MRRVIVFSLAFMLLPSAFAQAEKPTAPSNKGCWGVAIELRDGPVALLAVRASGDKEAIKNLVTEARSLGLNGKIEQAENGQLKVFIPFPSPPITGAKARDLVERAHAGAFGSLKVAPEIMDISILPRRKCPDAYL